MPRRPTADTAVLPAPRIAVSPRRGLRREEAALYVGVSPAHFDSLVATGEMPKPLRLGAADVWDLRRIDRALQTGLVYFLGFDRYVKIGWTKNISKRIRDLESGLPIPLTFYGGMAGGIRDERALHRQYKNLRLNGEWFRREDALAERVAELIFDTWSAYEEHPERFAGLRIEKLSHHDEQE